MALVAGAGRRCTYTVCTYLLTKKSTDVSVPRLARSSLITELVCLSVCLSV